MHGQLVMRDDAWPTGSNVDEVNLLYKTSGSNLARDFYVLPDILPPYNVIFSLRIIIQYDSITHYDSDYPM